MSDKLSDQERLFAQVLTPWDSLTVQKLSVAAEIILETVENQDINIKPKLIKPTDEDQGSEDMNIDPKTNMDRKKTNKKKRVEPRIRNNR